VCGEINSVVSWDASWRVI